MNRAYAALPHEYLEEMADLTDEEWGRLTRALLRYSVTGEESELAGNERFFWVRVKNREGRYQAAFEESTEKYRAAARARWDREREMRCNATQCNTNTNTEPKPKTKTDPYTNSRRSKERRDEAAAAAYGERLKKDMRWLEEFCERNGSPSQSRCARQLPQRGSQDLPLPMGEVAFAKQMTERAEQEGSGR